MPGRLGQSFDQIPLRLSAGGHYNFNAVSRDNTIAASISTSGARTASGKRGVGKLLKIHSDIMFLLLADVHRRLVVLTEPDMYLLCQDEVARGRMPKDIEFLLADLPQELRRRLQVAREVASREVTPI
jgi:hypothetical protein